MAAALHPPATRRRCHYRHRSCGICKDVLRELEAVCRESRSQRARTVFLRHDLAVGCVAVLFGCCFCLSVRDAGAGRQLKLGLRPAWAAGRAPRRAGGSAARHTPSACAQLVCPRSHPLPQCMLLAFLPRTSSTGPPTLHACTSSRARPASCSLSTCAALGWAREGRGRAGRGPDVRPVQRLCPPPIMRRPCAACCMFEAAPHNVPVLDLLTPLAHPIPHRHARRRARWCTRPPWPTAGCWRAAGRRCRRS